LLKDVSIDIIFHDDVDRGIERPHTLTVQMGYSPIQKNFEPWRQAHDFSFLKKT